MLGRHGRNRWRTAGRGGWIGLGGARWTRVAVIWSLIVLLPAALLACSVPVFRYALEHWAADHYKILVYHDADLDEQQLELVQELQQRQAPQGDSNVQVITVDLRLAPEDDNDLMWKDDLGGPLPRMAVQMPRLRDGRLGLVGTAPWRADELGRVLTSPARQELAKRLVDGEVVWLFLSSGNPQKDLPLFTTLESELAHLQETLKLREIDPQDLKDLSIKPEDLKIKFGTMIVERHDPVEKWLVDMLLSTEADLRDADFSQSPMVFPVFGRGRVLHALIDQGINPEMIKEAAVFLTGDCQCEVKADNPGADLLIAFPWEEHIVPTGPEEVVIPLVGLGGFGGAQPEVELPGNPTAVDMRATRSGDVAMPAQPRGPPLDQAALPDPVVMGHEVQAKVEDGGDELPLPPPRRARDLGGQDLEDPAQPIRGSEETSAWLVWLPWGVLLILGLATVIVGFMVLRSGG